MLPARFMQLVNQKEENIELTDRPEARGCSPEPTDEFPASYRVDTQNRQNLPEPARCDACTMERFDVASFESAQRSRESFHADVEELGGSDSGRHR